MAAALPQLPAPEDLCEWKATPMVLGAAATFTGTMAISPWMPLQLPAPPSTMVSMTCGAVQVPPLWTEYFITQLEVSR